MKKILNNMRDDVSALSIPTPHSGGSVSSALARTIALNRNETVAAISTERIGVTPPVSRVCWG
jgi:hypothetical protein